MTKAVEETVNPRARAEWAVSRGVRSGSVAAIEFGKALRLVRGELTQEELAAKCGVSSSIWNTWETGKGLPGEQSWRLIKAGLGRSATERLLVAVEAAKAIVDYMRDYPNGALRMTENKYFRTSIND